MEKRAYSRLERDNNGIIRVVFYDAETSLPVTDLTGYSVVALDEKGQAFPVNSAPVGTPSVPASQVTLPTLSEPTVLQAIREREELAEPRQGEGGEVAKMDLEPTGRFVGPGGLVGLALGDEERAGNTGWRNSLLTGGLGLAASTLIGGPAGLAAGVIAKGVVNSDKFKDNYNDKGQLSGIGVGPGRPKAPEGPQTDAVGLGVYPDTASQITAPTPVDNLNQVNSVQAPTPVSAPAQAPTQSIGQQRTNIPTSSAPIDGGYPQQNMREAPSMAAFNRREPQAGTFGRATTFDRTGLSPSISRAVDAVNEAVPGVGINSGYRSPERNAAVGGARSSQHIQGNAVDLNTAGWTNEQKRDALEAAVQSGVRGVGIYNSGNSIHIDTRREPTTWGPSGYTGSKVDSMPEWSRDTLKAMYGAGPDGQVGPRIGPTPKSREQALSETPVASTSLSPIGKPSVPENDLAFTSRPDFASMTPGQVATSGFGKKPSDAQIDAMAYTLAGELDPRALNDPRAVANLAATLNNRIETVGYKDTFTPSQYNSLSAKNRATTDKNYAEHGESLRQSIRDMYDGKNTPDAPDATHYYNPSIANPDWGVSLRDTVVDSGHRIGTIPGEYTRSPQQATKARQQAEDNFTSQALASQVGRNVENIDKKLSNDARTSITSLAERERAAQERQINSTPGSLEGSRYSGVGLASSETTKKGFAGKEKDDNVGSSKESSSKSSESKSSSSSSSGSKGFAGKDKDDNVGSSSSSSKKSGGITSSSAAKSGDGFASRNGSNTSSKSSSGNNSKSTSSKSKDDSKDSKSSSNSSKSSSSSSSSGGGKKK